MAKIWKVPLMSLCLVLMTAQAQAISNYNPTVMDCADVRARIRPEGVVMLRWTSPRVGVPRYGRYVRNSQLCPAGERAQGTLVPARDRPYCAVSECRPFFRGGGF